MRNQLLGSRYRILDRIGEGGMAYVYLALDEKLGRKVAIKVLHEHMEKNHDIRKRFQLEAEAVSRLDHPNIVKIYDFSGGESDRLWLVTEVIRGKNLAQYAEKGGSNALHPVVATCIVREILKALTKAHDIGIVHRDIKPENVMITVDGRVKLMDFGIAKDLGRSNVTQTGTFMGSPSYMSPEQIRGRDVEQRSDLYSLSVLFYEIVTGRLPFVGQTTHEVVMRIVDGAFTEPRFIVPSLPETLNDLIIKGMAKRPEDRHESARAYGTILDQFLAQLGFDESHVELERYAQDKSSFEDRLLKTQIMPPLQGSIALRLQTSRLQSPDGSAKTNQGRALPPAPPYVTDRRTVPRSYGAKRFKSSHPVSVHTQAKTSSSPNAARSQAPSAVPRKGTTGGKQAESSGTSSTQLNDKQNKVINHNRDYAPRQAPPIHERPKPPLPRHSALSALRRASPAIPETGMRPVLPPPPPRRLPRAQRMIRRRSAAPAPRPVRIAVVRPSFLSRAMGFVMTGLLLGISMWGFLQLDSRMAKVHPPTSEGKKETSPSKQAMPPPSKQQAKAPPKRIRNPFIPVKQPSGASQPKKEKNLAMADSKSLEPDRPPTVREDKNDTKANKPNKLNKHTTGGQSTPKSSKTSPDGSSSQGQGDPKQVPVVTRPTASKEPSTKEDKLTAVTGMSQGSPSPQGSTARPTISPPATRESKGSPTTTPEKPEKAENATKDDGTKLKSSGSTAEKNSSGRFKISSQPASEIFLDGKRLGTTVDGTTSSSWLIASAGRHTLELKRQGYSPYKSAIDIKAGEDQTLPRVDLEMSGPDTTAVGGKVALTIAVNVLPAQVTVHSLDSSTTQVFPMKALTRTLQLSAGRYSIKIEHKAEVKERELTLNPSQGNMTFSADFKEKE